MSRTPPESGDLYLQGSTDFMETRHLDAHLQGARLDDKQRKRFYELLLRIFRGESVRLDSSDRLAEVLLNTGWVRANSGTRVFELYVRGCFLRDVAEDALLRYPVVERSVSVEPAGHVGRGFVLRASMCDDAEEDYPPDPRIFFVHTKPKVKILIILRTPFMVEEVAPGRYEIVRDEDDPDSDACLEWLDLLR